MLNNKYLTEFLGTLFLLYVILASGNPLAIGAALAAAVMVGKSSGGHFNPAVSVAMVQKKIAHEGIITVRPRPSCWWISRG